MKRILWMTGLALLGTTLCSAQSLGDYAKQQRSEKKDPAKKVYTNDDIPTTVTFKDEKPADSAAPADPKQSEQEKDDKAKKLEAWKNDLESQKKKIADLQHEVDLLQREMKMRGAVYYADAGARLRDSEKWTQDQKNYEDQIKQKQEQIAAEQAKLDGMNDQARKEGLTSKQIDGE